MKMYAAGLHVGAYILNAQHTDTIFYYDHSDWLGTECARMDLSGSVCESMASLPFGDSRVMRGSCTDVSPIHFTGKLRDAETGLDSSKPTTTRARWASQKNEAVVLIEHKEHTKYEAKEHNLPLVRQRRAGGGALLRRHFSG